MRDPTSYDAPGAAQGPDLFINREQFRETFCADVYLVSEQDNAIPPDAERFMAQRMGATTETITGSHTAFIARPVAVAAFIRQALTG